MIKHLGEILNAFSIKIYSVTGRGEKELDCRN